jgi:hypothetical protein
MAERELEAQDRFKCVPRLLSQHSSVVATRARSEKPERFEDAESLTNGAARCAESDGELALGWEPVACGKVSSRDRMLELLEDLLERALTPDGLNLKCGRLRRARRHYWPSVRGREAT